MLTEKEVGELRYKVVHRRHYEQGVRYHPAKLLGGPLAEITPHIKAAHSHKIGWCVITKQGVVQASYLPLGDGEWQFYGFSRPGSDHASYLDRYSRLD